MITLFNKSKQYGTIALKVLILSIAFGYLYKKVILSKTVPIDNFIDTIRLKNKGYLLLFLGFAIVNWVLEIIKWKTVVSAIKKISLAEAAKQSLASLTISLVTPNRIGEYGAKAYFFNPKNQKRVLLINLFSNLWQLLITFIFGITGLIYVIQKHSASFSLFKIMGAILLAVILLLLGYFFKEKEIVLKGLSISKVMDYFKKIARPIFVKTGVLSMLRYCVFSSLFIIILCFFGAEIDFLEAIAMVASMYLLSSIIPSIFIFDTVVKGSVAIGLFSLAGVSQWNVLCSVFLMWILNFGLPAVLGSFYIAAYKRK